jgi:hypothetical protein
MFTTITSLRLVTRLLCKISLLTAADRCGAQAAMSKPAASMVCLSFSC